MFWGVTILGGRRYTQTVDKSYHISKAVLDVPVDGKSANKRVQLMLEQNKSHYLLCNLDSDKIPQVDLDLIFTEGEEVTFYLKGDGTVHLSGYILDFDDDDIDEEGPDEEDLSDEQSEDEQLINENSKRSAKSSEATDAKKIKVDSKAQKAINGIGAVGDKDEEEDDDDDDDDDDDKILGDLDEDLDSLDEEDDEEDDDDEEEEDDDDDEPAVQNQKPLQKLLNGQAAKQQLQPKTAKAQQNQKVQENANKINTQQKKNHLVGPKVSPQSGQKNNFNQKQQQKGGSQQKAGQFNQNKQPFNKQKAFTPDQKASKNKNFNFNQNKNRKSFA